MDKLLIETLINWAPMLLLIAVWVFVLRQMRGAKPNKYQQDCMDLTRRQAEALERIAAALEKKSF